MSDWAEPPPRVTLAPGETHVWRVALEADEAQFVRRCQLLSADEMARAARFRLERDRRRFVMARSALRLILADSLDAPPEALRFDYGPQGKPALSAASPALAFNISHSEDLALVALRVGGPVGVDIERVRADIGGDEIAARFFCPAERAWLHARPAEQRPEGFFCLWTRKEAYIKARGSGLWHDLDGFDVSQSPPLPVRSPGSDTEAPWFVRDLPPGDDCRAAIAGAGPFGQSVCGRCRRPDA